MYNCMYKIRVCVHWKKYIPREGTDGGHRIQDVKSNKKKKKMFVYKFDTTLFSSYILFHVAVCLLSFRKFETSFSFRV